MKDPRFFLAPTIFLCNVCVVFSATFTVTKTSDDGSTGTLRWAIDQANQNGLGHDLVDFNISSGLGPHVINLQAELVIDSSLTMDGYTQGSQTVLTSADDATQNTLASGNDSQLKIVIDGSGITPALLGGTAIVIGQSDVTIRGLVIRNAAGYGLGVVDPAQFRILNTVIEGCFIGIDADGLTATPNQMGGIYLEGQNGTIGGPLPAQRNVIQAMVKPELPLPI